MKTSRVLAITGIAAILILGFDYMKNGKKSLLSAAFGSKQTDDSKK